MKIKIATQIEVLLTLETYNCKVHSRCMMSEKLHSEPQTTVSGET